MAGYFFNLPQLRNLTRAQQSALDETEPVALCGGPGTGKSVVSLWRHISNYKNHRKSLLITYTTTLVQYLKACSRTQNTEAARNVRTSLKGRPKDFENWDEIIVDEAQDLPISYYYDIKGRADVSYGADDSQVLYPEHSSTQGELSALFPNNEEYVLDRNFRSTYAIMRFAKTQFPKAVISSSVLNDLQSHNPGVKPSLMISNGDKYEKTNDEQDNAIIQIIDAYRSETQNIAILVPWKSEVKLFEEMLKDHNVDDFSVYYEDPERFPEGAEDIKNIHITTFKSAKGLEFDTVILPNYHKVDEDLTRFNIEWKDFYVAVTRARSNLFMISNYNMPSLASVTDITRL